MHLLDSGQCCNEWDGIVAATHLDRAKARQETVGPPNTLLVTLLPRRAELAGAAEQRIPQTSQPAGMPAQACISFNPPQGVL